MNQIDTLPDQSAMGLIARDLSYNLSIPFCVELFMGLMRYQEETILKSFLLVVLTLFFSTGCNSQEITPGPLEPELEKSLDSYRQLGERSIAKIAKKTERGERLIVLVRMISRETGEPIANHTIRVFQADIKGSYGERVPGDETTARISGDVTTDKEGRFLIDTILPGDYGTISGNRHIHMHVPDAKPEAYDFFFDDFVGTQTRSWANSRDQVVLLKLSKTKEGTFVAKTDLPVKGFSRGQKK